MYNQRPWPRRFGHGLYLEMANDSFGKKVFTGCIVGGVAGCMTTLFAYPTEYVKIQLQLDSGRVGSSKQFKGILDCIKQTMRSGNKAVNVGAFYRGVSPVIFFAMPRSGIRLATFDTVQASLQQPGTRPSALQSLFAGMVAGAVEATLLLTPAENMKVKFIHDTQRKVPHYRGMFHGIYTIYKEIGAKGLYGGYSATLAKQASNQAIRFAVYEALKKAYRGNDENLSIAWYVSAALGGASGAISCVCNNPIDVVKTKMQSLDGSQYRNSWECCQAIYRHDGIRGFYVGLQPRMARVMISVAITFTIFDGLKPAGRRAADKVWETCSWDK